MKKAKTLSLRFPEEQRHYCAWQSDFKYLITIKILCFYYWGKLLIPPYQPHTDTIQKLTKYIHPRRQLLALTLLSYIPEKGGRELGSPRS